MPGLFLAASAAGAAEEPVLLIETEKTDVVAPRVRLERFLQAGQCSLPVVLGKPGAERASEVALVFLAGTPQADKPALVAVNRQGQLPRSVWVTRRTAGVRSLSELEGRDLSIVKGPDPLGAEVPLSALAGQGVHPARGQLYGAGEYSSALGLLLHNNTHASVSEAGFLEPFRKKNDLVVTWSGEAQVQAGWYRGALWKPEYSACTAALGGLRREDDRQIFSVFPGWVFGFEPHGKVNSEDSVQ